MTVSDAEYCAAIVRSHARTFHRASGSLPPDKRRATFAVYAFCRIADDLADAPAAHADVAAESLAAHEAGLDAMLAGRPEGPIFRELALARDAYQFPVEPLHHLVRTVEGDIVAPRYADWPALRDYCEGVASTVGEVCAHIFGLPDDPATRALALSHACTLGLAMQLTNILRDVGEDAALGRCYLPADELERAGLSVEDVMGGRLSADDERWIHVMQLQIGRARELYEGAAPGIVLLAPDAQRCTMLCARGYARILDAIEGIGYDSLARRARVGMVGRLAVMVDVWRNTPAPHAAVHA